MIFVTVGSQFPFERLIAAVDDWAARRSPRPDVLAQVGSGRVDYRNLRCVRTLDVAQYAEAIAAASIVVAHAGIGTILNVRDRGVPIVVMPRDHLRGEIVNDHQVQTARKLEPMGLVAVAWSEADLPGLIEAALAQSGTGVATRQRSTELVDHIRSYLRDVLGK